jgi:hypothetical protein
MLDMEEYNKELVSALHSFEPEDITTLSDILKDLNEFNEFDNLTLKEIIDGINSVISENENSKLSNIKKELNEKYLNQYIKYSDDDDNSTIYKKVENIIVEPAFGGSDFAIKFISTQIIYEDEYKLELKMFFDNDEESYKPVVLYSFLKTVEIISEKEYYEILEKYNINLKKDE